MCRLFRPAGGAWVVVAALAVAVAGCGSNEFTGINRGGTLAGKVTLDGTPVGGGEVQVYGADGKHSASATIRNDGSYSVADPPLGPCKIAVVTSGIKDVPPKAKTRGPVDFTDPATGEWPNYVAIPSAYEDKEKSGLTAEVKPGANAHDLPLTKGKK